MALKNTNERLHQDLQDSTYASLYLKLALEEGGDAFRLAVRDLNIAKNGGMAQTARKIGCDRGSLYSSLGKKGNPSFDTIIRALRSAGMMIDFVPCVTDQTDEEGEAREDSFAVRERKRHGTEGRKSQNFSMKSHSVKKEKAKA